MRTAAYVTRENIAAKTRTWLDHVRERVAPRPHLRPEPGRCALLVVDMLRYFAHPDGRCHLPAADAAGAVVVGLVERWRRIGAPVVFTRHCHEGPEDLGMLGRFFSDYIHADEPDSEIIESLAPRSDEAVVRKTTYDAFSNTRLDKILGSAGVDQVLVTGVLTHMCCETTARTAFCRGFEVYVAADATASSREELHLGSLVSMADSVAVIVGSEEVLQGV